jgi:hypothetical protein
VAWVLLAACAMPVPAGATPVVVDDFASSAAWRAIPADGVLMKLSTEPGPWGPCLRVDFDFQKGGGYAVLHRDLDLALPANYRFLWRVRGLTAPQNLEFKLADSSGANVWWCNRRNFAFSAEWETVTTKRRQISFAWGPKGGGELARARSLEFAITAGSGGKGTVWFDALSLEPLALPPASPPAPIALAASGDARAAVDGDSHTAWTPDASERAPTLGLDLGYAREFGGLILEWEPGRFAPDYDIELGDESGAWRTARSVRGGNGGRDFLALPGSEARRVRIHVPRVPASGVALREVAIQPLEWSEDPNHLFQSVAKLSPRGRLPRMFLDEQTYWAVVGTDGGRNEGLLGEDGALETGRASFSIEPFLWLGDRLVTWADVTPTQSLAEDELPVPSVQWKAGAIALSVTAFAVKRPAGEWLVARYRLKNGGSAPVAPKLALALRPFQVDPPQQFLNTPGGVAPVGSVSRVGAAITVNGERRVTTIPAPENFGASAFDAGDAVDFLAEGRLPAAASVTDASERASAAATWTLALKPGEEREVDVLVPLDAASAPLPAATGAAVAALERECVAGWRKRLSTFELHLPDPEIERTVRAQLGWILVNRDGPGIQPGSRSYERSWIRDGSLTSTALLRAGIVDPVREYLPWFAGHQFANGKIPCCVDNRGSDPVPEHDSHGEFIYLVAEYVRLTGDLEMARKLWPNVAAAVQYLDDLRHQRLGEEWRAEKNGPFYGILPPSISHEGYSAEPMHSYWDDLFALRGFRDATWLATRLGMPDSTAFARLRDTFGHDLGNSVRVAMAAHGIDFMPGCADQGDFDATSTTIALDPVQALDVLPRGAVERTFEKYWDFFVKRRDGSEKWDAYTPYETRSIGAYVELGYPERAKALLDFFLKDRRPTCWKQWAEVVDREYRHARFIGDMPHTWVGSDFVRSVFDMLAYERESDRALVVGAGVPKEWLAGQGLEVKGMRTRWGTLGYSLRRQGDELALDVTGPGLKVPPGGIVWMLDSKPVGVYRTLPVHARTRIGSALPGGTPSAPRHP